VAAPERRVPTSAELRAFGLGQLDPQRYSEVEAHLAGHPECLEVVEATLDDDMMQHLRGAGALPKAQARPLLLQLAVEAVIPMLGGCAGALIAGPAGGLGGVVAGQAVEKAINFFGPRIVEAWRGWLQKQPAGLQAAALTALAEIPPEVARIEVASSLAEQAPKASPVDRQLAIDYLSAIPRSVRRSLLTGREKGGRQLPPTISPDDSLSLLQLLPTDLPPYTAPTALPGTDYQLVELIGSGGFGAVYRASSPSLQYLPLAIKFCLEKALLPALQQERANLERLMKAGGKTWSPRLVRLYGYNLEHRTPFLVYEFVAGGDLVHWLASRRVKAGQGLTPAEALALITQVADALAFAHERGLVHRDLKPANVLIGDKTIKLADFGIGGLVARQAVQASKIGTTAFNRLSAAEQASLFRGAGTPLYMSQEQKQGAAPDPRHDIYSLGVMWYQLLVGDVTREMAHGWARELEAKFTVPARQISLIEKCVGWIEERPKEAGALLPLLRGLQEQAETQKGKPAPKPKPPNVEPIPVRVVPVVEPVTPPILPTAESERLRQIRFVTRMAQLQGCHAWKWEEHGFDGLMYAFCGMVVVSMIVGERYSWLLGWAIGLGSLILVLVLSAVMEGRGKHALAAKIEEVLTEFPKECQIWGGWDALADRVTVEAILRKLETPQR